MKLKIEKDFVDKYNGKTYKAGAEVEFKDERADELLADPRELVTKVKATSEDKPKEAPKKPAKKTTKK